MAQQYYIEVNGQKEGPLDILTVMRRIRANKILSDTMIWVDDAPQSVPAGAIQDIALFFAKSNSVADVRHADLPAVTLSTVLRDGLRFTFDHNIMTVYAGGMVLLAILLAAGFVSGMGPILGGMLSWIVFVIMHYIYFVCTLRIYRMQPFSADFMNRQLGPVLPMLLFSGIVLALMMVGGFFLLVIPAVVVAVFYIFVPFFIYDRHMSLIEAMVASRLLVQKHNRHYQKIFELLVIMHLACLVLIFPVPVTLPMFAAAMARIYEELSIS